MVLAIVAAGLAVAPFWERKPPAEWTDDDIQELLTNSPWAQQAISGHSDTGVQVYLATARPAREAEEEKARRVEHPTAAAEEDPTAEEYADFLRENEGRYIVLAIQGANPKALADPAEIKRMEERCVLKIGTRQYRMTGYFPPSPSDEMLRLVFPRAVTEADEKFRFELNVPGVKEPNRFAEFRTKELRYKGKLEM